MFSVLRTALTSGDNATYEIGRLLWFLSFLALVSLNVFTVVVRAQPFDLVTAAAAYGGLLVSGAGALRLRGPS